MKVCKYCGSDVHDDMLECPHCSAVSFMNKCTRCGSAYEGPMCPICKEADESAANAAREAAEATARAAEEAREKAQASQKANQGLVWKTILTVFLPFIGGYFLLNENVGKSYRVFATIWCSVLALSVASSSSGSLGGKVVGSLLCLAPIGVYLFKTRGKYFGQSSLSSKVPVIAFCILLVVTLLVDVAGAASSSSSNAASNASSSVSTSSSTSASSSASAGSNSSSSSS